MPGSGTRSVQVSADGRRLALRAGDRVVNLHGPIGCWDLWVGPDGRTVVCSMDESRLDLRLVDGLGGG